MSLNIVAIAIALENIGARCRVKVFQQCDRRLSSHFSPSISLSIISDFNLSFRRKALGESFLANFRVWNKLAAHKLPISNAGECLRLIKANLQYISLSIDI